MSDRFGLSEIGNWQSEIGNDLKLLDNPAKRSLIWPLTLFERLAHLPHIS
jgi:hypothetical protein